MDCIDVYKKGHCEMRHLDDFFYTAYKVIESSIVNFDNGALFYNADKQHQTIYAHCLSKSSLADFGWLPLWMSWPIQTGQHKMFFKKEQIEGSAKVSFNLVDNIETRLEVYIPKNT